MTRVIVLAAFIASAGSAANAQTDVGEIRLTVTGAGGAPIVAAGTLASDAPQMRRSFVTDAEGRFTLGVVPFGVYVLTVEAAGYASQQLRVDVRTALPHLVPVSLVPAQQLQQSVEVTANLPLVDAQRTGVAFTIPAPHLQSHLSAVPGRIHLGNVAAIKRAARPSAS